MNQILFRLPTIRIEIEKPGKPKETIRVYRMIYRQWKHK